MGAPPVAAVVPALVTAPAVRTKSSSWFYLFRSVLVTVFAIMAVYRRAVWAVRRTHLRFLTFLYTPLKLPQLIRDDVSTLLKLPRRVLALVELKSEDEEGGGIEGLTTDCGELAAWTLAAGIPHLSFYEPTGVLKEHVPELVRRLTRRLSLYFGPESVPPFSVSVPSAGSVVYSGGAKQSVDLKISLLSQEDGKQTIVALTRSMATLAKQGEMSVEDVSVQLINSELTALVGHEPDLLVTFAGALDLQGYPPWHIRLSEIYFEEDNEGVNYAVFYRALAAYSRCKVNVGK